MKTLCIVPFHTISKDILDFLYKAFDVPDTVPYYKHTIISNLFNDIVTYIVTILPETEHIDDFINNNKIFVEFGTGLIHKYDKEYIEILKANQEDLKLLILHVIHELRLYLPIDNDEVYIIYTVDDRNLMCYKHHMNKESDQLVFNGSVTKG